MFHPGWNQQHRFDGLVCAVGLLGLAALTAGCGRTSAVNAGAEGAMQAMPVQVQIAKSQKIPDTTEYLSILKSRHSATINPQVEGQITRIFVKSGDRVKAGTPLLQIDPLKQQATVSSQEASRVAQEANLRYAKVQLDREKKLFEAGVVAKQELDNAQTNYDAAEAQLRSLEQQVTTQLTTVDEPGAVEAYIYVPADRARDLKMGVPVHLIDAAGRDLADSTISFISSQVDTETQTVLAKAIIPAQANLRTAQQVRAQLVWGSHTGTVIPILAVTRINGEVFAFLAVKEGNGVVARQKLLKVGDAVGNDYAVLDGIKAGDHIIVSGLQFLRDGAPVVEQVLGADGGRDGVGK